MPTHGAVLLCIDDNLDLLECEKAFLALAPVVQH